MKKAITLGILAVFVLATLAGSALATQQKVLPGYSSVDQQVTLTGKVVFSRIEKPHYELVTKDGKVYVLVGPFDFGKYVGKFAKVTGIARNTPNIYMRGSLLYVQKIEVLSQTPCVPCLMDCQQYSK